MALRNVERCQLSHKGVGVVAHHLAIAVVQHPLEFGRGDLFVGGHRIVQRLPDVPKRQVGRFVFHGAFVRHPLNFERSEGASVVERFMGVVQCVGYVGMVVGEEPYFDQLPVRRVKFFVEFVAKIGHPGRQFLVGHGQFGQPGY